MGVVCIFLNPKLVKKGMRHTNYKSRKKVRGTPRQEEAYFELEVHNKTGALRLQSDV